MPLTINSAIAAVFVFLMLYAAISDVSSLRIPNWISIAAIGLFGLFLLVGGKSLPLLHHGLAALTLLAVGFAAFSFGYVGGGDVKLATAVGLWAGPQQSLVFLFWMSLFGAGLALVVLVGKRWLYWDETGWSPSRLSQMFPAWIRKGSVPYGVAISAGAVIAVPSVIF